MLILKRNYPLIRREAVVQTACDRAFDAAEKAYEKAGNALGSAAAACLRNTGMKLLDACTQFDRSDRDLAPFVDGLRRGLAVRDFITIGAATRNFVSTIDRSKIPWSNEQDPEAALASAVIHYSDALESWAEQKYPDSHQHTVMCRSALTKIGN